jgi:hypothetical protein|tara:strand:+ start:65 stop:199 length:135 start_codon:yes stop_codon:yes gene_type:complete
VVEQVILLQQVHLKEIMVVKLDLDQTILVAVVELVLQERVVRVV